METEIEFGTETYMKPPEEDAIKKITERKFGLSEIKRSKLRMVGVLKEARDYIRFGEIHC